jgi:hypothetical protein
VDSTKDDTDQDETEKDGMLVRECNNNVVHGIYIVALILFLPGNQDL